MRTGAPITQEFAKLPALWGTGDQTQGGASRGPALAAVASEMRCPICKNTRNDSSLHSPSARTPRRPNSPLLSPSGPQLLSLDPPHSLSPPGGSSYSTSSPVVCKRRALSQWSPPTAHCSAWLWKKERNSVQQEQQGTLCAPGGRLSLLEELWGRAGTEGRRDRGQGHGRGRHPASPSGDRPGLAGVGVWGGVFGR